MKIRLILLFSVLLNGVLAQDFGYYSKKNFFSFNLDARAPITYFRYPLNRPILSNLGTTFDRQLQVSYIRAFKAGFGMGIEGRIGKQLTFFETGFESDFPNFKSKFYTYHQTIAAFITWNGQRNKGSIPLGATGQFGIAYSSFVPGERNQAYSPDNFDPNWTFNSVSLFIRPVYAYPINKNVLWTFGFTYQFNLLITPRPEREFSENSEYAYSEFGVWKGIRQRQLFSIGSFQGGFIFCL